MSKSIEGKQTVIEAILVAGHLLITAWHTPIKPIEKWVHRGAGGPVFGLRWIAPSAGPRVGVVAMRRIEKHYGKRIEEMLLAGPIIEAGPRPDGYRDDLDDLYDAVQVNCLNVAFTKAYANAVAADGRASQNVVKTRLSPEQAQTAWGVFTGSTYLHAGEEWGDETYYRLTVEWNGHDDIGVTIQHQDGDDGNGEFIDLDYVVTKTSKVPTQQVLERLIRDVIDDYHAEGEWDLTEALKRY